jgi:hypothetical protein
MQYMYFTQFLALYYWSPRSIDRAGPCMAVTLHSWSYLTSSTWYVCFFFKSRMCASIMSEIFRSAKRALVSGSRSCISVRSFLFRCRIKNNYYMYIKHEPLRPAASKMASWRDRKCRRLPRRLASKHNIRQILKSNQLPLSRFTKKTVPILDICMVE